MVKYKQNSVGPSHINGWCVKNPVQLTPLKKLSGVAYPKKITLVVAKKEKYPIITLQLIGWHTPKSIGGCSIVVIWDWTKGCFQSNNKI